MWVNLFITALGPAPAFHARLCLVDTGSFLTSNSNSAGSPMRMLMLRLLGNRFMQVIIIHEDGSDKHWDQPYTCTALASNKVACQVRMMLTKKPCSSAMNPPRLGRFGCRVVQTGRSASPMWISLQITGTSCSKLWPPSPMAIQLCGSQAVGHPSCRMQWRKTCTSSAHPQHLWTLFTQASAGAGPSCTAMCDKPVQIISQTYESFERTVLCVSMPFARNIVWQWPASAKKSFQRWYQ